MKRLIPFLLLLLLILDSRIANAQVVGTVPTLYFRETGQTLPLGLWHMKVTGDQFIIEKNTASNGAFGTTSIVMSVTGGIATFPGNVATPVVSAGTTPATAGCVLCIPSAGALSARNNANGGNIKILQTDAADNTIITAGATVELKGAGAATLNFDGTNLYSSASAVTIGILGSLALDGAYFNKLEVNPSTPADNATCSAGQIYVDTSFIYVCTASGTVKRAALSTF